MTTVDRYGQSTGPVLQERLGEGLRQLGWELEKSQQQKLLDYLQLLSRWNRVYNLTAIRDPLEMLTHHVLDSLAAVPEIAMHARCTGEGRGRVLDVGSGGGLPGIPLAIVRPDLDVQLVDVVQKKTAFLMQAKTELGLSNLSVATARIETLSPSSLGGAFDVITSRAFSELANFVSLAKGLLKKEGRFVALKGLYPEAELRNLPLGWRIVAVHPLAVPGLQAERHLVVLGADGDSSDES